MPLKLRRILVPVRDLKAVPRTALRKAAALAQATGARIELFHALADPSSSTQSAAVAPRFGPKRAAPFVQDALARAQRRLERIAQASWAEGCEVGISVAVDSPVHEAIVRRALASRADLVIAGTRAHGRMARFFLRNTDWELIRHCPGPLLLVKSPSVYRKPAILVAVDPFHVHAKPALLDAQLLAAGQDLARLLGGSVHIFHAYMPLPASVEGPFGQPIAWSNIEMEQVHAAQVRAVFDRLADKANIARSRRHLVLGDVASELEATVRRVRAAFVVMGAVSRSGLRRIFIGNTAERVLDRLSCDVLILKPRGFRTGVPRTAASDAS